MLHQIVRYSAVVPFIEELGGGTVLDVGSGNEGVASWLGPNWSTTAIDRSFDVPGGMRGPYDRGPARMLEGDARALPFADREFDVVLALDVMEHIGPEHRGGVLSELARVAGRRLVVAGPAGRDALASDQGLAAGLRGRGMDLPTWLLEHEENGFPEADELRAALEPHGRVRLVGSENLHWHRWLFRFEFRRPGFHASRVASEALARRLCGGGVGTTFARAGVRVVQGPRRGPHYRAVAVVDRSPARG
jgi:SAM-dependent methyltransferase